jgi:hypothetical protein
MNGTQWSEESRESRQCGHSRPILDCSAIYGDLRMTNFTF